MVKVFDTCLEQTLQHLSMVEKHPCLYNDLAMYGNLKMYQADLRLYRMLLWCIPDAAVDAHLLADLNFIAASVAQLYKIDSETDSLALPDTEYNSLLRKVDVKRFKCGDEVTTNNCYFRHLMSSFSCEAHDPSCGTMEFLDSVHAVLNDRLRDIDKTITLNLYNQIESLVETVFLLHLIYYTSPQTNSTFQSVVHDWANKAACFSLLQGLYGIGKEVSRRLQNDLQQTVNPCNPDFIKLCFQVIKVPKMKHVDRLFFGEFVSRFVDFFLDNLLFVLNDDHFPMIREGLIFLITFLADPPANILDHTELMPLVQEQIYDVLDQASYMCFFSEANIDLSRGKMILDAFLKSIDEVRGDIVNHYFHIPPLPWSDFPRINRLGFFECLLAYLENLKDALNTNRKPVPFLKHQIITIHQELLPLRSFLQDTWVMQNKHTKAKDIWELICQADFAIKSSFFNDNAIWYNLTCLSFVVRKIKDIRFEVETQTKGSNISNSEAIQSLMSSMDVPKPSTSTSNVEDVVGFENETELLIDRLLCGSAQLDIVPIVGMGGIGKTTLAKKLYNDLAVKNHFYKRAFCSVSQVYRKRDVLLAILSDLSLNDDRIQQMSVDDLAQCLRQSLLGSRYLIVVDDIWDINVWDDMKASFPTNSNGSRIILTTRISNLSKSNPFRLPLLSVDESWELLRLKVFHKDPCPPHLLKVGKMIATNCKGLPLSIVHDLIRDFCRTEAQEKNHLHYINAHNKNFPMSHVLHQHRISIEGEWRSFVNAKPRGSTVHSLLFLSWSYVTKIEDHCEVNSLQSFLSNFKLVTVLNLTAMESFLQR